MDNKTLDSIELTPEAIAEAEDSGKITKSEGWDLLAKMAAAAWEHSSLSDLIRMIQIRRAANLEHARGIAILEHFDAPFKASEFTAIPGFYQVVDATGIEAAFGPGSIEHATRIAKSLDSYFHSDKHLPAEDQP